MISLASIAQQYQQPLLDKYGEKIKNDHRHALQQIINCHTPRAGALLYHCDPLPSGNHLVSLLRPSTLSCLSAFR